MKICVFTICKNEVGMMPFFLRHYSAIADKIIIWDEHSTDGTRELIEACPKAELRDWPYSGIDDWKFKCHAEVAYKEARGQYDWCIWPDSDEFIWAPDIRYVLKQSKDFDVIGIAGFNMIHEGLPKDDGRQIWEIAPMGVNASVYAKKIVFNPACEIKWSMGKHSIESIETPVKVSPVRLNLLHYRFMGESYTRERNARNWDRNVEKSHAWSCAPTWTGAHSATYAKEMQQRDFNVISMNPMKETSFYDGITLGTWMEAPRSRMFQSIEMTMQLEDAHFVYLELGVAGGRTLSGMCHAMTRNNLGWSAIGVDLAEGGWRYDEAEISRELAPFGYTVQPEVPDPATLPAQRALIVTCGSEKFLRNYKGKFNFVFIDACHSAPCCTRDFVLVEPLVKHGGIVAFHDSDEQSQGDGFELQPHCNLGIGVRRALLCMDLLNGKREGWRLLADVQPGSLGGRGAVFVQKL